ncbi:MAG TPA: sulfatase [Opitutaceae bacterium]|nr:sulfatase [Opitutaceae bacterium]HND60358.1 sulfatase [Opitutaceae bacterium]
MKRKPNILFFGIDSLRSDHMSLHGYPRLTTPHLDKYLAGGTVFERQYSPHIPTTPGYSSMFTGMDCFGTDVVALRHQGGLGTHVKTLAELLGDEGYATTCVGFSANPASRGFQKYIDFTGWGSWSEGRSPKAENLNAVTIPELKRLAAGKQPFFLFMRHMDPHSPYLPPGPFERIFYGGNELDPKNRSLEPVYKFKPFCDYFASWFPPGCTDKDYVVAQYDGAIAYMDACIADILATVASLGIEEETLVVVTSDHGETLYDHECWFDHHGLYDTTLAVPLAFVWPGKVPAGVRVSDFTQQKDTMPTLLDLIGLRPKIKFDGRSLVPFMRGRRLTAQNEFYITEATWMRKHGWRTPRWKYIEALEPDFHYKPQFELYDLVADPEENHNLAKRRPDIVKKLRARMLNHIAKREKETGRTNPMYTNLQWHGKEHGPYESSDQAYNEMYIGSPEGAKLLQARELQRQRGCKKL